MALLKKDLFITTLHGFLIMFKKCLPLFRENEDEKAMSIISIYRARPCEMV